MTVGDFRKPLYTLSFTAIYHCQFPPETLISLSVCGEKVTAVVLTQSWFRIQTVAKNICLWKTTWMASQSTTTTLHFSLHLCQLSSRLDSGSWVCSLPVLSQLTHSQPAQTFETPQWTGRGLTLTSSSLLVRVFAWPFSQGPMEATEGNEVIMAPDIIGSLRCPVPQRLRCLAPQRPLSCHQSCLVPSWRPGRAWTFWFPPTSSLNSLTPSRWPGQPAEPELQQSPVPELQQSPIPELQQSPVPELQ